MVHPQDSFLYISARNVLCFFSLFMSHSVKLCDLLLQETMESIIKNVKKNIRCIHTRKTSLQTKLQNADSWECMKVMLWCAHFFLIICPTFLCLAVLGKGCYSQLGDRCTIFSPSRETITAHLSRPIRYLTQAQAMGNENQSQLSEGLSYLIESSLSWSLFGLQDFSECKAASLFMDFIGGTNINC